MTDIVMRFCPFCGDKRQLEVLPRNTINGNFFQVYCWFCSANGSVGRTEKEAITKWNYSKREEMENLYGDFYEVNAHRFPKETAT